MKLEKWSYTKRYNIKAYFDLFPHSQVIFRQIKNYYFVYTVKWDASDPVVTSDHLEQMEKLLNIELDTYTFYLNRVHFLHREQKKSP